MAESAVMVPFICPGCSAALDTGGQLRVKCPQCSWTGDVYTFSPRVLEAEAAKLALPEDATCLHHPRKKAIAVCAGTGDYVCSLCAIELNGQTYSAEFLTGAGKDMAGKAFDRTLARPDSQIVLYLICCFIPYVNFIFLALAFVWIPHAVFLYFKLLRLRRENPIMQRLVGRARLITLPILLGLFTIGWIVGLISIIVLILNKGHRF